MPTFEDNVVMRSGTGNAKVDRTVIDKYGRVYLNFEPGNQYYVDSGTGSSADDGKTWASALDTIKNALAKVTANNGDVIWVAPGHAESIDSATDLAINKAGVTIIGMGNGADRPTITFASTDNSANIPISAASVYMENILCVCGDDGLTAGITISAADCTLKNIEWRDATDVEATLAILTTAAADRLTIDGFFHNGFVTGNACTDAIRLVGCNNAVIINSRFLGNYGTAIIEFHTTACTNVVIDKCFFLETGTTDLSKNVVDTVTGSTWYVNGYDVGAGCSFSGGSGAALAKDDVSTISSAIGTLVNTGGTATLGGILGDVNNVDVATSLAKLGTLVNTGGTATVGGILGDVANVDVATRLGTIDTVVDAIQVDVGDASARTNLQSLIAMLGNPDTAGATIWSQIYAGKQYATKTISTFAGGDDNLFTFTGSIRIHSIIGRVTTQIQAQATTLKLQAICDALADYDMCATLDVNAFAVGSLVSITGTAANNMVGATGVGAIAPAQANPIDVTCVTSGVINLVSGAASTGAIAWEILWEPLSAGAGLTSA